MSYLLLETYDSSTAIEWQQWALSSIQHRVFNGLQTPYKSDTSQNMAKISDFTKGVLCWLKLTLPLHNSNVTTF